MSSENVDFRRLGRPVDISVGKDALRNAERARGIRGVASGPFRVAIALVTIVAACMIVYSIPAGATPATFLPCARQ